MKSFEVEITNLEDPFDMPVVEIVQAEDHSKAKTKIKQKMKKRGFTEGKDYIIDHVRVKVSIKEGCARARKAMKRK